MKHNENTRKLIKVFLTLNPKGSVSEFSKCKKCLQSGVDLLVASGNQRVIETM